MVKKNFKKEFRGHMEQTKKQNRHLKINYVIPKICQKGKSDNMKEILKTKSVIGKKMFLFICLGCYNKIPSTNFLTNQNSSFFSYGDWKFKSKTQIDCLGEVLISGM